MQRGRASALDQARRERRVDRQHFVDRRESGGLPGLASYAATKGAVDSFTKGLATEVGPEGVRVNAVAPGFTATDMNRNALAQPSFRERMEGMTPLRRIGAPEEIAEAAAWLISPAAAFVTGSVVTVSGGR